MILVKKIVQYGLLDSDDWQNDNPEFGAYEVANCLKCGKSMDEWIKIEGFGNFCFACAEEIAMPMFRGLVQSGKLEPIKLLDNILDDFSPYQAMKLAMKLEEHIIRKRLMDSIPGPGEYEMVPIASD